MQQVSLKKKIFSVLAIAFIVALVLRVFVFEAFVVRGDSMAPAVHSGDYVFVNKLAYRGVKEPERGDIVVTYARGDSRKILKRVVGMPGERFVIIDGKVGIKAGRKEELVVLDETYLEKNPVLTTGTTTVVLDPREYFVLGDNREVSVDSRELGSIDEWDIRGRVFGLFSFKRFSYQGF